MVHTFQCHACAGSVVAMHVRGQGEEVDLLFAVSKFASHFRDNSFHHLNIFHFH